MQTAYCIHDIANLKLDGTLIDVPSEHWFSRLVYAQGSFTISNMHRQDLTITFEEINPGNWNAYAAQDGGKPYLIGRITEFRFPDQNEIKHFPEHL